ncbi:MAG: ECF transporter S component [Bacillota bacterium]
MKKNSIQDLTLTAVFAAIILVMIFVPQLGFITLTPFVSITIVHIPVLIGVFLLPKRYAILLGLFFGIGSWIRSFTPMGPLDIAFNNPLISVLPRVLFALAAAYIYEGLKALDGKFKNSDIYIFGAVIFVTAFGTYYGAKAIADFTEWNFNVLAPIALVVIGVFITLYFAFVKSNDKKRMLIPSTLIISTVVHTILVLTALVLLVPQQIIDLFGSSDLLGIVYTVAVTNGLVEALAAVVIGTPIVIALQVVKNKL